MDDPVRDIHGVVRDLCQSDPRTQAEAIDKYFGPQAQFTHPFCQAFNNRTLIHFIFRWYKIMSPHIDLDIKSVAYDSDNLLLYVTIHQIFRIWLLPFHRSSVTLTTVLQLTHANPSNPSQTDPRKFYIESQNDLYQVDQFVRFFLPWFNFGPLLVLMWHFFATVACVVGCAVFYPVTWFEQRQADRAKGEGPDSTARKLREQADRALVNGSREEKEKEGQARRRQK